MYPIETLSNICGVWSKLIAHNSTKYLRENFHGYIALLAFEEKSFTQVSCHLCKNTLLYAHNLRENIHKLAINQKNPQKFGLSNALHYIHNSASICKYLQRYRDVEFFKLEFTLLTKEYL